MSTISPASGAVLMLLPHALASVASARRVVVSAALQARMPRAAREDLALVVSELVTNALRHARPLPDGHIELGYQYEAQHGSMRVHVRDGGAPTPPRARKAHAAETNGRGLAIVARLASSWGVLTGDASTTVWALVGGMAAEPQHA